MGIKAQKGMTSMDGTHGDRQKEEKIKKRKTEKWPYSHQIR